MMLKRADCMEFLSSVPSESVDLVVVDPPYYEVANENWDKQWSSEQKYLDWCFDWTQECLRVLKPNKCFYVWGTTKTNTFLRYKLMIEEHFIINYQNWIIWSYDWGGRTKKTFPRKHEDLLMYSKGATFPFYADAVRVPYKVKTNVNAARSNNPNGKVPTDVWEKNNHTMSKEYIAWHPTQKPISILERIIKANTLPNETVLDCFSGSGSTMLAANNTGRNFIGCEKDQMYFEESIKRLGKTMQRHGDS